MNWEINKARPIRPQIEEQLCVMIACGEYKSGEKILSVRDVAVTLAVNPNTVQRAFESLEEKGLLTSVRGSGWFVSENTQKAADIVEELSLEKTREYLRDMTALGATPEKIQELIKGCNK